VQYPPIDALPGEKHGKYQRNLKKFSHICGLHGIILVLKIDNDY
jgi:hypothetical protein